MKKKVLQKLKVLYETILTKGYSMASRSTLIFKSIVFQFKILVTELNNAALVNIRDVKISSIPILLNNVLL